MLILGSFDVAVVVVVVVKLDRVVEIPRFQKLVSCAAEKNYVADLKEQNWDVKKYQTGKLSVKETFPVDKKTDKSWF